MYFMPLREVGKLPKRLMVHREPGFASKWFLSYTVTALFGYLALSEFHNEPYTVPTHSKIM
jgi:hypothetical protein